MPPPETSWPVCLKDGMQSERSKTNIIVGRSSNVTCINLFPLIFHAQLTLSTKIIIDIHGLFPCAGKGKVGLPLHIFGSIQISDTLISDRCSDVILTK